MNTWITKSGYKIIQILSGRSNVFLVTGKGISILIDTSTANHWKKLEKNLDKLNINTIDFLVLTHTHFDHAANAAKIKDRYNPLILLHESEKEYLETGKSILPHGTNIFTENLIKLATNKFAHRFYYAGCKYDRVVDGYYQFANHNISIIHTPGHSLGSVSIIVDSEIALVGDALFGVFPNNISPPFADNIGLLKESWKKLLATGCHTFLPSHGKKVSSKLLAKKSHIS